MIITKRASTVWRDCFVVAIAASVANVLLAPVLGAQYQWDFSGNLNSSIGAGALTYADASSESLTTFGTSDGVTVPDMNGQPTDYMYVPAFTELTEGYYVEFTQTGPNGDGIAAYVNQYTMIFDVLIPDPINWVPFFNTNFLNGNDADFYVAPDNALGIGELGYTPAGAVATNTWHRIAFTADLISDYTAYYIDGTEVHIGTGTELFDGRFSLYSNVDEGPDLLLFNEGDESDLYTHDLYISSYFMEDRTYSAAEIQALGGPDADGILDAQPPSPADYNGDGIVNAADYTKWRDTLGSTTDLAANGNGNTVIDSGDYNVWRAAFGASGAGANAAVPEPATIVVALLAAASFALCGRQKRCGGS